MKLGRPLRDANEPEAEVTAAAGDAVNLAQHGVMSLMDCCGAKPPCLAGYFRWPMSVVANEKRKRLIA
jgi:hypothetical protein